MLNRILKYFDSYDRFVQFQYAVRRRFLETNYKWFQKLIVRNLNNYSFSAVSFENFNKSLSSYLCIPEKIFVSNAERATILAEAEKTVEGIYDLLGSGDVILNPIDWHTDFKTGIRWSPGKFFRNYIQEGIDTDSDVKVPRELSRCHHLLNLGLAYKLTKDERYALVCINQILDWIDENPLMYSVNWGCTMDVAIRAVNWIWTLGFIVETDALDIKTTKKILGSLYQHGWYIWRNPEKELIYSSNHYLSDIAGQVHLGLLFKDLDEPKKWLEKGKHELFHEIRQQILPSGMSYERSTNYNRLVLELILIPILLLKKNGHEIPGDILYRLEKMFEFIMFSLKPDGTSPIVGDQDNGRLLPFGTETLIDFRYLLSLGALLFNRPDFKSRGDGLNIYCSILGGHNVSERWNSLPVLNTDLESMGFPDAGIFISRHRDNYLLYNASGKGIYPELIAGGHTHSDLLSFELFTHGKSFLVDPGSYVYTADADQRMLFRSTKMHNTVVVDGESQDVLRKEKMWGYGHGAIPEVLKWESNNTIDQVTAAHNGYLRLPEPVKHERTILFDKIKEKWIIKDSFSGEGYHSMEWFFHFDVGIDFSIDGNIAETNCKDNKNIRLIFESKCDFNLRKEHSFVSKSYGRKERGYVLVALVNATLPVELEIEIIK